MVPSLAAVTAGLAILFVSCGESPAPEDPLIPSPYVAVSPTGMGNPTPNRTLLAARSQQGAETLGETSSASGISENSMPTEVAGSLVSLSGSPGPSANGLSSPSPTPLILPTGAASIKPTSTPHPTETPLPARPTATAASTQTPLLVRATATAAPTETPISREPTSTPQLTPTPVATEPAETVEPTQTPVSVEPAETAGPTQTPVPPEPSATPVPIEPTSTPVPTNTPVPTATPLPPEPGTVIWRLDTGDWVNAKPLIADDTVYIGSQNGLLYALHFATGKRIWSYDTGSAIYGGAATGGGVVTVADLDGVIHAVDRSSGDRIWAIETGSEVWGRLSADADRVYSAHQDGAVYASNLIDGAAEWSFQAGDRILGGTAVVDGLVYFASLDDSVYALDAKTGQFVWATELLWGSISTPTVSGNLVLVGSWDERVYALDAKTGRLVWNFWASDSVTGSVAATGEVVVFGSDDGNVYSVSLAEGSLYWRRHLGAAIQSSPAGASGVAYIGSDADELVALDTSTGDIIWTVTTGDDIVSGTVVDRRTVFFGSNDGTFYAVAADTSDHALPDQTKDQPEIAFELLSARQMKELLTQAFGSRQPVLSTAVVHGANGRTIEERDRSPLVAEVFRNGYYLLTGRTPEQHGWELRYLTREDYIDLAIQRGEPSLTRSNGWCCIRTDTGLALIMRGDNPVDAATAVTAHEAGHAIQRVWNPVQSKAPRDSLIGAFREAEAYAFEVALTRKIGEFAHVETARWPSGYAFARYLDDWREGLRQSVDDPSQEHDRGRLLIWQAVLHDPEQAALKEELFRDGQVSGDSMYDLFLKFVAMTSSEIEAYVESISSHNLSDDLNIIFGTVNKRTNHSVDFPELTLNVPTLVISP